MPYNSKCGNHVRWSGQHHKLLWRAAASTSALSVLVSRLKIEGRLSTLVEESKLSACRLAPREGRVVQHAHRGEGEGVHARGEGALCRSRSRLWWLVSDESRVSLLTQRACDRIAVADASAHTDGAVRARVQRGKLHNGSWRGAWL